jgi:hypothetical protein
LVIGLIPNQAIGRDGHLATDGLAETWIRTIPCDSPFPVDFAKEHFGIGI